MMNRYKQAFLVLALVAIWPASASALVDLSLSLGTGVSFVDKTAHRAPFSLELMPSYRISIFAADLGMLMTMEKPVDFILRPGIRVIIPWFYARAAFEFKATHGVDYGFLLGIGSVFLDLKLVRLFVEADTHFLHKTGWSSVPLEFRLGATIGF